MTLNKYAIDNHWGIEFEDASSFLKMHRLFFVDQNQKEKMSSLLCLILWQGNFLKTHNVHDAMTKNNINNFRLQFQEFYRGFPQAKLVPTSFLIILDTS